MASKKPSDKPTGSQATAGLSVGEAEPRAASYGDVKPTMVNGRYVGDKTFNEATGDWEATPEPVAGDVKPEPEAEPADAQD